jgi:chromosome partitioning protein
MCTSFTNNEMMRHMNTNKLVGISEIAGMSEPPVSRQAVGNWRVRYDDFPKPVETLQSGPVWDADQIQEWLNRKSGRAPIVISFINLKGGVAKTTTSVAVAEVLASVHRKHVLFIDLDPQTNATINLIGEDEWKKRDEGGLTLAQLFNDRLEPNRPPKFSIGDAIVHGASRIDGGISRLDLLPSSIEFIDIQEKLPFVAMQGNYEQNPQEILRQAIQPVIDRYDYVIIDCPPSLGVVTKNGLRISTHYAIPTIPDIVSTWGIFQIVTNIDRFSESIGRQIKPLGIIATKVNGVNTLHSRIQSDLRDGRLFQGKTTDLKQPSLFPTSIQEATATSRGADFDANVGTFKDKYGPNAEKVKRLTAEIIERCHVTKS